MPFQYRRAVRKGIRLVIGMTGGTNTGKTYSAIELAIGLAQGRRVCVIDTENERALHYADQFDFDHVDFQPPFGPDRYAEAIKGADKNDYGALIIDSGSHSHIGEGGMIDLHETAWAKFKFAEKMKMLAWAKPKQQHRNFIQAMLRAKSHVILCLRAEHKVEISKDAAGKMLVGDAKWQAVCEKHLPFELITFFLFEPSAPGVPIPIKLQEQHRHMFPAGQQITREMGAAMAAWAAGGSPSQDPAKLADLLGQITAAATPEELEKIGAAFRAVEMSQYDRAVIVRGFVERRGQLKTGA